MENYSPPIEDGIPCYLCKKQRILVSAVTAEIYDKEGKKVKSHVYICNTCIFNLSILEPKK